MYQTDNTQNTIREESPSHHWRTELPNIVEDILTDPYEFRVYMHMKRRAGDGGACFESNRTMAEKCGMGKRKLINIKKKLSQPRKELNGRPLIFIQHRTTEKGDPDTDLITIVDVWDINLQKYYSSKRGGAPHAPGVVHDMHEGGAPHAPKEEPSKKIPKKFDSNRTESFDKIHDCLKDLDLDETEKINLTKTFPDAERMKGAVEWATRPGFKPDNLVAVITENYKNGFKPSEAKKRSDEAQKVKEDWEAAFWANKGHSERSYKDIWIDKDNSFKIWSDRIEIKIDGKLMVIGYSEENFLDIVDSGFKKILDK